MVDTFAKSQLFKSGTVSQDDIDLTDITSFLRSDAVDTATGNLTFDGIVNLNKTVNFDPNGQQIVIDSDGSRRLLDFERNGSLRMSLNHLTDQDTFNFDFTSGSNLQINGNRILTTADEGSGNGLDADTLDGNEASAFATAAQGTKADTAYGWGDHSAAGYLTSYTDTNTTYSAGTGITLTGTTFSNSAPDQTVTLTGSGATTVSGTYPNFTISSTDTNTDSNTYVSSGSVSSDGDTLTLTLSDSSTVDIDVSTLNIDTNTTYSAGTGITLTGTTFSVTSNTYAASSHNHTSLTGVTALSGTDWSLQTNVTSGVYDDATSNANYSRLNIDSLHTNGIGQGQTWIEGSALDFNATAYIGTGKAGGQTYKTVTINNPVAAVNGSGSNTIWHAGNDGDGSGLDADTLDGNEASAFVAASGDIMTGNLSFGDNNKAIFGAGNDLEIYHDGTSDSYISDTNNLTILGNNYFGIGTGNLTYPNILIDSNLVSAGEYSCNLYHSNLGTESKKLETTNTGIDVTGNISLADDDKSLFGTGDDLQIYHNGSSSYIDNNTNHLYIRNNVDNDDGGNIYIQAKSGEHSIIIYDDSHVSLYDNGVERLRVDGPIYAFSDFRLQGSGYDLIYDKGTYLTTLSSVNPASQNQTIYLPDASGYASVKSFSQAHELSDVSGITLTPADNWRKIEIVLTVDSMVETLNNTTPKVSIDMTANGSAVSWRYYKNEIHEYDYWNQVYSSSDSYIYSYYFNKESILILNLWRTDDTNDCRVMFDLELKESSSLLTTDATKFYKISGTTSAAISKLSHQILIGLSNGGNWNGVEYFTTVEYHN